MRVLLILWLLPLTFFWGWYGLSYYDINFGFHFFSRRTHDVIFQLYAKILQMPRADVPWFLAKIFAFDSLFIVAIAAWRWRAGWYPQLNRWFLATFFPKTHKALENEEIQSAGSTQTEFELSPSLANLPNGQVRPAE